MRWVVIIVVVLLAFILAIFAAGAVLPRKHVASVATSINQPPQVVWQVITAHANDPQWRPDLKTIQRLPNRNGHPVWLEIYKNDMKLELEDVEADAPNKLVREVRDTGNMFSGRWVIEITPAGPASSTIRITEYGEVPNPFFRFMSRFVFGHTKSMEQYLTNLHKRFGESALGSIPTQ
jgi:hypothetical protein